MGAVIPLRRELAPVSLATTSTLGARADAVFAETLPAAWPGYAAREGQLAMARAVAETLDVGGALACDAPCGTGKSLAYLVPAILRARASGRTAIVATASIALQEQLVAKDLPALARVLDLDGGPLTFALLKGRQNYACFAGETRVITRNGIERIDHLAGGTHKLLDGHGRWVDAPVKSYGVQRLMRLTLSRGHVERVIYATPEHRWIVRKANTPRANAAEKTTATLVPGDRIPSAMPMAIAPKLRPSPFGIAHGITFGDGSMFGETPGGFRTATVVLHGAKRALARWFPNSQVTELRTTEYGHSEDAVRVWDLPRFFKDLPSIDEAPSYLYGWLAGWFATDGHIGEGGSAAISSARRENLEFAQRVCLRLGIEFGDISTSTRVGKGTEPSEIHTLTLVAATLTDEFFLREKHATRHSAVRRRPARAVWTVRSVEMTDRVEEVFCAEVPTTHSFALERFILTGNCKNTIGAPAPAYLSPEECDQLARVDAWGARTATGDRAELPFLVEDSVWSLRSVSTDDCLRDGCDHYETCHARAAKARAEDADIVVVNQHLLAAHLAVYMEMHQDAVLPRTGPRESPIAWDTLVIDEAHELPDIAREFFGCDLTEKSVTRLGRWCDREGAADTGAAIVREARALWSDLDTRVPDGVAGRDPEPVRIREGIDTEALCGALNALRAHAARVSAPLRTLVRNAAATREQVKTLRQAENAARRAARITSWLEAVACPAESPEVVLWIEARRGKSGRLVTLQGRHVEPGEILARALWGRTRALVATSATLTTGPGADGWHWIRRQIGAPEGVRTLSVESPFDFARQARLVLPAGMPDSRGDRDGFDRAVCDTLVETARGALAHGGVLGLFTSRRVSDRAAAHARAMGLRPVLAQGERPRAELVDAMRAGPALLCGTASLWTGVDLQGDACVALVIDKLPFPPPGDPVMDAISERLAARTGDQWAGFREELLPRAVLRLRQGVGRLIRAAGDRGFVVICDPRLTSARYGAQVVRALGLPTRCGSVAEGLAWLADGDTQGVLW